MLNFKTNLDDMQKGFSNYDNNLLSGFTHNPVYGGSNHWYIKILYALQPQKGSNCKKHVSSIHTK